MGTKEEDYREMFIAEALGNYEELNKLFTSLEKEINDKKAVNHIFRITHTLKGNAMGMGYEAIADLAHIMEDVFSEVKEGRIVLDEELFNSLFKANDKLGLLIDSITSGNKVAYKGIRTKLAVFLKNSKQESEVPAENKVDDTSQLEKIAEPEVANKEETIIIEKEETNPISPKPDSEELVVEEEVEEEEVEEEEVSEEEEEVPKIGFSDLVQVPVRKLDSLMNLVGELIIERDSLISLNTQNGESSNMFARLQRITSDLQYGVMDVRLIQIGFLFNKFHRIIRDVASIENKKVDLILEGTEIEIDRNVLKIMSDSLIHLIRNSVSHGIEKPEERKRKGKPERGKVTLRARNEKDIVVIEISDDGNGIDHNAIAKKAVHNGFVSKEFVASASKNDLVMLIFEAGFSNAEKITEVSGRGVGMDVVKKATESIGGFLNVDTKIGEGSTISLSLPSSLAVKGALLFELNNQEYAVGLTYTEAVISLQKNEIHKVSNGLMTKYLGKAISLIFLSDLCGLENLTEVKGDNFYHQSFDKINESDKLDVLVTSHSGKYVGFVVDKLLQQKEIVEKTLDPPINEVALISGATILGNGNVCLVLDVANIVNTLFKEKI